MALLAAVTHQPPLYTLTDSDWTTLKSRVDEEDERHRESRPVFSVISEVHKGNADVDKTVEALWADYDARQQSKWRKDKLHHEEIQKMIEEERHSKKRKAEDDRKESAKAQRTDE